MRSPNYLKKGSVIGVCAPSYGCNTFPYKERFLKAVEFFTNRGYKLILTDSVEKYYKCASAKKDVRAREFLELWNNEEVDFIFSCGGGEIMMEILEYIPFEELKKSKKPKFFMGYSDNTNLTFLLTTLADIKAIYGQCFPEFSMNILDDSLVDALDIIEGKKKELINYPYYHQEIETDDPFSSYNLTEKSVWKSLNYVESSILKGRIIGGCLDILIMLLGTKYDKVKDFINKYDKDGIIWYFEACDLNVLAQKRAYWQIKNAGWLDNAKAIIIGRPLNKNEMNDISYLDVLEELPNVPIIYDVEIGHIPPTFTIINGSLVEISLSNGKGILKYMEED